MHPKTARRPPGRPAEDFAAEDPAATRPARHGATYNRGWNRSQRLAATLLGLETGWSRAEPDPGRHPAAACQLAL
jgi:hypothetical protein